jgi:hypothetical protein
VYGGGAVGGDDLAPLGLLGGLAGLLGQLALVDLGVERTEVVVLPGQLPLFFLFLFLLLLLFLFLVFFLFISIGLYVAVDLMMMLALVDNIEIFTIVFLKEDCGKLGIVIIGFEWGLPLVDVIVDAVGRWRRARG